MSNKLRGFLALLSCGLIFGSFGIYIRLLSQDLDSYQQIFFRNIIALALATILMIVLRTKWSINKVKKRYIFLYTFSFALTVVLFTLSVLKTKILISIFSLYVGSIGGSLLLGILFFKEKLTKMKILSLFLVFVGLIFLAYPSLSLHALNIGFVYGLLAGLLDAIANSFRKYLAGKMERLLLVGFQMIGSLVVAVSLMLFFKSSFSLHLSTSSIFIGILFGVLLMCISYLTLIGFQNFDLNLGTIIISSELFFGPLFASIIFKEYPGMFEITGGIFILLAIIIPNLSIEKLLFRKLKLTK